MKKLQAGIALLLGGAFLMSLGAQEPSPAGDRPTVVLGTFDSRAIAMAYVSSDEFDELMRTKRAELERARKAGDEKLVQKLEAFGPALQQRIHRQGFGTAPVDDILAHVADELADIARTAGVDVIVSKWALTYRDPEAKVVDVTDELAAAFEPDERTWKTIHEIVMKEPVPLDELEGHQD